MPRRRTNSSVVLTDHTPLTQNGFRGVFDRGSDEVAPDNYFQATTNTRYQTGSVLTRNGMVLNVTKSNVRRFFVYKRLNETPRFIILDTSGNLFDSLAPGVPIYTDASFADFSMACSNNRAYITPHDRITGIAGKSVLVYQGSGSARLAGGAAPTGFTLTIAETVSSGRIEAGIHLFAIAYITDTGYITAPGPTTWAQITASGGKALDFSTIPIGPAGTVARVLLGTRSIPPTLYNGNQFAYELFFIPNGTINDNTTTVLNGVSFFDAELVDSADYLIDTLSTIPAGVGIGFYNGRMIVWGENANQFTVRVSEKLQPEVFNSISGFVNCDPADAASGIRNCFEHRKSLVICSSTKMLATTDNDSDPSTWTVPTVVDKSVGTECFGVATIQDARGQNVDRVFVADRSGLISFEGYAKRPELTWNIEGLWKQINFAKFDLVQVVDDPTNHQLLVSVPFGAGVVNVNTVFVGDYSEAITVYQTIDEKLIKWTLWTFPSNIVSYSGDIDAVTKLPVYQFALSAGNIYTMKDGLTDDFGNAIISSFKTSFKQAVPGWLNHFGLIHLRVNGTGNLTIRLFPEDSITVVDPPPIAMSLLPGKEFDRKINFLNEKMSIRFRCNQFGERFEISELTLYAKGVYMQRPQ